MVNPFKDTNWNPDIAARRTFARSLVIGFPVIAAFFQLIHFLSGHGWRAGYFWLAGIGAGIGLVLWLFPQIARPFYLAWYFFACCVGIVVSNALLGAFFSLAITPAAVVMRLCGRDFMRRVSDPNATTYWNRPEKIDNPQRYFRQY